MELNEHVVSLVGGVAVHYKSGDQEGPVYSPISQELQIAAVDYLGRTAFSTPFWLIDPAITRRFEPSGTVRNISSRQSKVLSSLLDPQRLRRVVEYKTTSPAFGDDFLEDMLGRIRSSIWSELNSPVVSIDPYRQELQFSYIARVRGLLAGDGSQSLGAYVRAVLEN